MAVYFIQGGKDGPVKIGVAEDIADRLAGLQTGHWCELSVIRTLEGGPLLERWLHRFYGSLRLRGEWFRYSPCMLTIEPPSIVEAPATNLAKMLAQIGGNADIQRAFERAGHKPPFQKQISRWRNLGHMPAWWFKPFIEAAAGVGITITPDELVAAINRTPRAA